MAKYKATNWLPLLVHVAVYTLVVTVFGLVSGGLYSAAIAIYAESITISTLINL